MKFNLSRHLISPFVLKILVKNIRKQQMKPDLPSRQTLREIARVSKEIETYGMPKAYVRKRLSKKLGYGIFLRLDAQAIAKGTVIAPYAGEALLAAENAPSPSLYAFDALCEIVLTKEEHKKAGLKERYHPKRHYAITIDAWKQGNFTRFINHSDKPNVVAYIMRIPRNQFGVAASPLEIVYFAKKTIRPGEQLLVSYEDGEKGYWAPLKIKPIPVTPTTFRLS